MIDELALFVFLILMIVTFVFVLGTYLLIISENMNKTDEERFLEDEEQMEYLKNYERKGKKKWKK